LFEGSRLPGEGRQARRKTIENGPQGPFFVLAGWFAGGGPPNRQEAVLRDRLIELLAPVVDRLGYELWELEFASRAGGGLLRLYIDSPQGITLDDCERVSHAVAAALDEADPIPGHYNLEISSPGLDRVLRTAAHFERFLGERARVEMRSTVGGQRRFLGVLRAVNGTELLLDAEGGEVRLSIDDIHKARLAPER
jgi:ribosome maturation factor RimP